jgi:integrase
LDDVTGDTPFCRAAERWHATITDAVKTGDRSPSTAAQYRCFLDRHVLPALGQLRLREVTTSRVDRVLLAIRDKSGAPTAKSSRTVISGVLGWAARQDAVTVNATKNTTPISTKPVKQPRALTIEEIGRYLDRLAHDDLAVRHDLIDLTAYSLATGTRIGESLAVSWDQVDLAGTDMLIDGSVRRVCTVEIDYTLLRVTGEGLIRRRTKTTAGLRTLRLPTFAEIMLRRRAIEIYVLRTGCIPAPPESHEQFCGFSAGFPAILRRSTSQRVSAAQTQFGRDTADTADTAEGGLCPCVAVQAAQALGESPVFPDSKGGWRDPSNTRRDIRRARGEEFSWVTSHSYRKTAATLLDQAGLTARQIANQMGHSRISMTQDVYMARGAVDPQVAAALEQGLSSLFPIDKPCAPDFNEGQHLA